jgi:hypothetical protein
VHVPDTHVSICVHAFPSLHAVPLATTGFEHVPFVGLHVPATWHWSLAVHVTGFDPAQTPAWQVSVCVHAFPSLHADPFAATGFEHTPVDGLQVPAAWHWSLAPHAIGLEPVHTPATQLSTCVHALPSLQLVPFATAGFEQTPELGSHTPAAWHWSLAAHVTGLPPVHTPA